MDVSLNASIMLRSPFRDIFAKINPEERPFHFKREQLRKRVSGGKREIKFKSSSTLFSVASFLSGVVVMSIHSKDDDDGMNACENCPIVWHAAR